MKPVYQTEFGQGKGNCLSAAIASLLEIDINEVPNFASYGDLFWVKCSEWMEERNMARAKIDAGGIKPVGYHLMTVVSPRGNFHHALVGLNGEPVHDPYPGGNCQHMGVASYFILYPIDPSKPMGKVIAQRKSE